jgi:hypothetical protein
MNLAVSPVNVEVSVKNDKSKEQVIAFLEVNRGKPLTTQEIEKGIALCNGERIGELPNVLASLCKDGILFFEHGYYGCSQSKLKSKASFLKLTNSLSHLSIPIMIPRRNKGHCDLLAEFSFFTKDLDKDPENFPSLLHNYHRTSFSHYDLSKMSKEIAVNLGLNHLKIIVDFSYPIDRASSSFKPSIYNLSCKYESIRIKEDFYLIISTFLPIVIADVHPITGRLSYGIRNPKQGVFIEDLVDHIQRYTNSRLYPLLDTSEKEQLKKLIDSGKSPKDYLKILKDSSVYKDFGEGGYSVISVPDVYNTYMANYSIEW